MPSFESLARWRDYVPSLGANRELQNPFILRLAAGLTAAEYKAVMRRLAAAKGTGAEIAEALVGVAELGPEPLTVNGKPVATLAEYVDLIVQQQGGDLLHELLFTLGRYNSVEGAHEDFFGRGSGFGIGTSPARAPTAHSPSGSGTSLSRGPTPPAPPAEASSDGGSTDTPVAPV